MTIFGVAFGSVMALIFVGGSFFFSVFFGVLGSAIFEIHKDSGNLMPTIMGFAWLIIPYNNFEEGGLGSAIGIGGFIGFAIGLLWGLKMKWDTEKGQ